MARQTSQFYSIAGVRGCPIDSRIFPLCVPSTLEQGKQVRDILEKIDNKTDELSSFYDTLCTEIWKQEDRNAT